MNNLQTNNGIVENCEENERENDRIIIKFNGSIWVSCDTINLWADFDVYLVSFKIVITLSQ